ncbi:TetR/AcrR family transcriptional regulator [Microbaculum marinisediminis]|uniref:TetR/AcrR family transcriptional regulator n=1 Tax=Microbaculum marinisediminis TaxID=2931392 RepID=A0AAW5QZT7_9HYPH|nr:TetR/AcrR family transcriptional regulator [Microbaculum sp. A6E488]MCT8971956.1 TetR/AcrR family transcriptional regulator [Microbaculum sp. A6E488]
MARKTTKAKPQPAKTQTAKTPDDIVDAALGLAAEQPWDEVRLTDIAARAGVSLSALRAAFDGKIAILAAFIRRIDQAVLDALDPELSDEPARERLFDVLMTRFDALMPYKEAVRSIAGSFERRPGDLIAMNPIAVRSMVWMLEAAGIDTSGRLGMVGAQGLAVAFGRTLRVWLKDDDPGMARTMVELDRRLTEGGRWMRRLEGLASFADAIDRVRRGRRRRRRRYDADPEPGEEYGGGI